MAIRHVRGSDVQVDQDGGTAFNGVGCLAAMSMPPLMRGTADVTCMNKTDFYREFIKGFKDSGEAMFRLRFEPIEYSTLKTIFEDDNCTTLPHWRFLFGICPEDDQRFYFSFYGILTKLDIPEKSIDGENTWEVNCTIKISGQTVFDFLAV